MDGDAVCMNEGSKQQAVQAKVSWNERAKDAVFDCEWCLSTKAHKQA